MLELTKEQQLGLRQSLGCELHLSDPDSGEEYVLLRAHVFDRIKALLYDDSEVTLSEAYPLMDEMAAKAGWDDPEMEIYNEMFPKDRQLA